MGLSPTQQAEPKRNKLDVAAITLAVLALIIAFTPVGSFLAWIPAGTAIALGIIRLSRRSRKTLPIISIATAAFAWLVGFIVAITVLAGIGSQSVATAPSVTVTTRPTASATPSPTVSPVPSPTPTPTPTPSVAPPVGLLNPVQTEPIEAPRVDAPTVGEPAVEEPVVEEPVVEEPAVDEPEEPAQDAYYANCKDAKAAGAAPLYQGEPGYRSGLDRDGDGVACET